MKTVYLVAVLICFLSSCKNGNDDQSELQIDLEALTSEPFVAGYEDSGITLKFNSDGTFEQTKYHYTDYILPSEPRGWLTTHSGTYKVDSNSIMLEPLAFMNKINWGDSTVTIDSLAYYQSDSTRIRSSFSHVEWNGNTYLLSEEPGLRARFKEENDFVDFANNYNSGSEPQWPASYFAKRKITKRLVNLDLSQIPSTWRPYFIDSVAFVVVTDIERNFAYDSTFNTLVHRYFLKGGTSDQVLEGMTFYGKNGCCTIKIMESGTSTSNGIIDFCPFHQNSCTIGDTLTTWNQRDYGI